LIIAHVFSFLKMPHIYLCSRVPKILCTTLCSLLCARVCVECVYMCFVYSMYLFNLQIKNVDVKVIDDLKKRIINKIIISNNNKSHNYRFNTSRRSANFSSNFTRLRKNFKYLLLSFYHLIPFYHKFHL